VFVHIQQQLVWPTHRGEWKKATADKGLDWSRSRDNVMWTSMKAESTYQNGPDLTFSYTATAKVSADCKLKAKKPVTSAEEV
jgi:hypothetical protein